MTISEIITEVTREIGEDSSDSVLATNLLSFCTAALRRLPKRVRDRSIITIGSTSLTAASQTASLPTNFIKERMVWHVVDGNRIKIEKSEYEDFNQNDYNSSASGTPSQYRIYGSVLEFDVPADQNYTIYLEYFKALTTTTIETSSTFALREDAVEPYKDLVKAYYYESEDDDARASGLFRRALAYFMEMDDEFVEEEFGTHIE